ncbi:MAG: S-adenosylmethionine decarboxylase [Candidatus Algichlamydia australiensis]|nr:S-adenosylmethionine decarboxylase [Chlamydiales bacterium]
MGEEYAFKGKHFIASYYGCKLKPLCDLERLKKTLLEASNESGASVLNHIDHQFEPNGLTMVILLSESHASIHTYPEHRACFIGLFTFWDKYSAD